MKWILPLLLTMPFATLGAQKQMELTGNWKDYFTAQIERIEAAGLRNITNIGKWTSRREQLRTELAEMLCLWPMPDRTDLKPVVTGRIEESAFTVEKLHFQASPQLYVTANLYLPRGQKGRAPGVLYVCGHSRTVSNGVSYGNKVGYQHHGAWFAKNGFVCLIIDTLQYGEILGAHRGTYSDNEWWWNSRGYTPAGIEAWFGIRALDYLCSRPEVDPNRIGMTGRSGGGAYTWTVAALDDRVKVAAPIAGMTDLRNQILNGCVDGHCDCMFQVNTHRWDFPMIGALIAPRPLLIGNSDKDRIFPLDGVLRCHAQIQSIYRLYGKEKDLGLVIAEGDHNDTQELQVSVFRWFIRYLKPDTATNPDDDLFEPAKKYFKPEQLKVFEKLPADERNTTAAEWFNLQPAEFRAEAADTNSLKARLLEKTFAGWPEEQPESTLVSPTKPLRTESPRISAFELPVQGGITQKLYSVTFSSPKKPRRITLVIADDSFLKTLPLNELASGESGKIVDAVKKVAPENDGTVHILVPTGVGDALVSTPQEEIKLRRRFMLLGQTLDSMRVLDIRTAAHALRKMYGKMPIKVVARGEMAVNAAYAALFQAEIGELNVQEWPANTKAMPDYLNISSVVEGVPGAGSKE
jgi:dienelactone hydrolase